MSKKQINNEKLLIEKLKKLFDKDFEERSFEMCKKFLEQNRRLPTKEEMFEIFDNSIKEVREIWAKHPENFKWVRKK